MNIQTEVQKIHHQFGVSEKANYEIQKLFDKAIKEAVTEALRIHDVIQRSEQSSKIIDGECMICGDVADTKDGWICSDCRHSE